MAHFAELNSSNQVLRVLVVDDSDIMDGLGVEQEQLGIDLLVNLVGGTWVRTHYDESARHKYSGMGDIYHETEDVFTVVMPYNSWVLDSEYNWEAPVAYPTDGKDYSWDEPTESWVEN